MLPSTGYFKGYNCPFYDTGLCERPYCHFRHVKKESQSSTNEGIESGAILQKLVSAAVQKVLQQKEASGATTATQPDSNSVNLVPNVTKVTYNPTPIAELKKINNPDAEENSEDVFEQRKRHIPVPYTPRKPAGLPIQRPIDTNGSSKPFIYIPPPVKYTPGSTENVQCDKYTPTGSTVSTEKYLPGSETELQKYVPNEGSNNSSKVNYVPSDKKTAKQKILEYKPTKVSTKTETPSVTYQPTPRSLAPCFSSDEDEPEIKKKKLSTNLNGLDDLGPEFDILDQILDEEKSEQDKIVKDSLNKVDIKNTISNNNDSKKVVEKTGSSKSHSDKNHNSRSNHRSSSAKKEKCKSEDKKKHEDKTRHSEHKLKHKSSSRDKEKDKKDKHSSGKKKHSSSKSSDHSSKDSKHTSSKKHDSKKHSPTSKHKSKTRDKDRKTSHKSSKESKKEHESRKHTESTNMSDNDDYNEELLDEEFDLESDEDAIALECKKIFDEYVPIEKPKIIEDTTKIEDTNEDETIIGKKRISRAADKPIKVAPKAPLKPDFKVSAAQTMAQRLAKVREFHSAKNTSVSTNSENTPVKNNFIPPPTGNTKIRIAHVPYASTLLNAKKTISPSMTSVKTEPSTSTTITQTVKKGAQRVAHVPNEKFIDRPGVLEPLGSKIAANIRSTYLNMMIDECLKLYLSAHDAYARAQHEELTTSKKCSTVQIYKNSAVLAVSRLRKELQECKGVKKSASDCSTLQKMPGTTPGKPMGSWSIGGKNKKNADNSKEFVGAKLYNNIAKWILTEEQLKQNGFPRPHESGQRGRAIIYGQNRQKPPKGFFRTCCRCKKEYMVNKVGFAERKEECIYHPNNKYRVRGEARYQCCSQDGTSDGCCVAPSHVYEYVDFDNLKGFVKTLPPETDMDDYGIYALDCEMCYTTHGLDLTRVTVINSDCKVVYETFIRPLHPIIDYNTRYSGITEEQLYGVTTTLLDVQATLLTMFNSKTILIGHSLESDFKVLKLIHDTVIDTSVLYPHKMGPPFKRALRNLSSEYLKKIIQNSVDGHDSAEDAIVCMELIHYKLKEDLKTR